MKLFNTYFSNRFNYLWLAYENIPYVKANKADDEEYEPLRRGWLTIGEFNNVLNGLINDKLIRIERGDNASN